MKPDESFFDGPKNTISEGRNYILFAMLLFAAGIVFGHFYLSENKQFLEIFQNLLKTHKADHYIPFVLKIFIRNALVAYVSIRFGIFLGIFPVFSAVFNGLMVGWLSTFMEKLSGFQLFLLLLPHGIFELSAMFIAWGLGLWRVKLLFIPEYEEALKISLKKVHRVYVKIVLPLLFIAALVEGRVML